MNLDALQHRRPPAAQCSFQHPALSMLNTSARPTSADSTLSKKLEDSRLYLHHLLQRKCCQHTLPRHAAFKEKSGKASHLPSQKVGDNDAALLLDPPSTQQKVWPTRPIYSPNISNKQDVCRSTAHSFIYMGAAHHIYAC